MGRKEQHTIDILFTLALFLAFAVLALFVVVLGANAYNDISRSSDENYNIRSSFVYLTEKIRQGDAYGNVAVTSLSGSDALVLSQEINNDTYQTWIYLSNGKLNEIFIRAGTAFAPEAGQEIMDLSGFEIEVMDEGLFLMTLTDAGGGKHDSLISLKGAGGIGLG